MKAIRLTIYYVVAIIVFFGTHVGGALSAQNVRVEVSIGNVVSEKTPRVFGYGGNIWRTPEVLGAGVADKILEMPNLGMTRVSLGEQILKYVSSLEDLQQRLESYPLNAFLRRYVAAGGKVLFILDTVPRWVSSNKSTRIWGPDTEIFRASPPEDYQQWSKVVEAIVRHFNGKLGLNAYYESWNEPNWFYLGTTEEFLKQYYYSVLGARRADPKAMIGGPSVSEVINVATGGAKQSTEAEKADLLKRLMEQRYLFKQFLDYAGRTAIPELGLKSLPVDFFSWHSFYVDPTKYYGMVVPVIREALTAAGYSPATPLINTEWNIAAVPPYPEGNLNATEIGAAFTATSLLSMHESKMDGQIFQMYVDPGTDGYYGGTFTVTGIPRANFHTFRLFSLLKGKELSTRTTDPWVRSAAFLDGNKIYLLVSTFVPTPNMMTTTLKIQSALENGQFTKSIVKAQLVESLAKGRALPELFASKAKEIAERDKQRLQTDQQKAAAWKSGLTLDIQLSGLGRPPGTVTRYLIDSSHSNVYPDLGNIEKALRGKQIQNNQVTNEKILSRLQDAGVSRENIERLRAEIRNKRSLKDALAVVAPEKRQVAGKVFEQAIIEAVAKNKEILREIENIPAARLHEESITWPSSGKLEIKTEPYSVQLFVFTL